MHISEWVRQFPKIAARCFHSTAKSILRDKVFRDFADRLNIQNNRFELRPPSQRSDGVGSRTTADIKQTAMMRKLDMGWPDQRRSHADAVHDFSKSFCAFYLLFVRLEDIISPISLRFIGKHRLLQTINRSNKIIFYNLVQHPAKVSRTVFQKIVLGKGG